MIDKTRPDEIPSTTRGRGRRRGLLVCLVFCYCSNAGDKILEEQTLIDKVGWITSMTSRDACVCEERRKRRAEKARCTDG